MSEVIITGHAPTTGVGWTCQEHGLQMAIVWLNQPGQPPFTNYCHECVATLISDNLTPMDYNHARD